MASAALLVKKEYVMSQMNIDKARELNEMVRCFEL